MTLRLLAALLVGAVTTAGAQDRIDLLIRGGSVYERTVDDGAVDERAIDERAID